MQTVFEILPFPAQWLETGPHEGEMEGERSMRMARTSMARTSVGRGVGRPARGPVSGAGKAGRAGMAGGGRVAGRGLTGPGAAGVRPGLRRLGGWPPFPRRRPYGWAPGWPVATVVYEPDWLAAASGPPDYDPDGIQDDGLGSDGDAGFAGDDAGVW